MAAGAGLMALASGLDPAAAGASEPVTLWPLYSRDRNVFGEKMILKGARTVLNEINYKH